MAEGGGQIRSDWAGDILVLSLDNPPSNALTQPMRAALVAALSDPGAARAIVICGLGRDFSASIPIDPDLEEPRLPALCLAVEHCPVPVVVALRGAAIGPGAELALAVHARVSASDARIAFPDVGIGLVPEAGASQRLPRLIGAEATLGLLVTGRAVPAAEAYALRLFDHLVDGDVLAAALEVAAGGLPLRDPQRGFGDPVAYQSAIRTARERHRRALPAIGRIIDCVEAAQIMTLESGLAYEALAREDLEVSDAALGLRSAARAERRAASLPPAVAKARPAHVARLGFSGAGPGMNRLALAALMHGFSVTWVAADATALSSRLNTIADRLEGEVRAGRLTALARDALRGRLWTGGSTKELEEADLVIHAGEPDPLALRLCLPGTPHVTLGKATGLTALAIAPSGRASELCLAEAQEPAAQATVISTLRRMALPPVLVGRRPGLGARLVAAGDAALQRLLGSGVPLRVIEASLQGFGVRPPTLTQPDPAPTMREMSPDDVVQRWLAAQVNEGLRLVEEGVAIRPSDADYILVAGHGFPRWRGGPMHLAERRGLLVLRRDLRAWAEEDAFWSPAPLIDQLIAEGRTLSAL
jgi:3-hydroxyacyl-CoA dehydrogenase